MMSYSHESRIKSPIKNSHAESIKDIIKPLSVLVRGNVSRLHIPASEFTDGNAILVK